MSARARTAFLAGLAAVEAIGIVCGRGRTLEEEEWTRAVNLQPAP